MTGTDKNSQNVNDSDELEPSQGGVAAKQVPAVVASHEIVEHKHELDNLHKNAHFSSEQYELHDEHVPLLPGQLLTDTIARLRFTIVLVSFFYSGLIFVVAILAVCLIAPNLLFWLDTNSPILINTARIIISLIAIGLAVACLVIAFKHRELTAKLATAEVMIDQIRDVALIQMQATRYNLEELSERLKFPKEASHPSPLDYIDLARRLGPVVQLLLAKERSVMTMAVEGLKLFQALKKVMNK
ncbi:MAG: hypothetical protein JSS86_16850 [Cyanobacteria bacterium SZAS LIN-2]|nr:hypothetical protein [Cyanobacteria bacterium SZAS LIN-2]